MKNRKKVKSPEKNTFRKYMMNRDNLSCFENELIIHTRSVRKLKQSTRRKLVGFVRPRDRT